RRSLAEGLVLSHWSSGDCQFAGSSVAGRFLFSRNSSWQVLRLLPRFRESCLQILGLPRVRLALSRYGQRRTVSVAQLSPAILLFSRGFQVRWIGELGLRS